MSKFPTLKGFPIYLVGLESKRCLVIGGTHEAQGKVKALLDVDAWVTVIAPELNPQLEAWALAEDISWIKRAVQPEDFEGAFLVIAERHTPEINEMIWQHGRAAGAIVNVMDDIPRCEFIAGSVIRQGPLTFTISTSGCAPALAVRLRQKLEKGFGPEYGLFLEWMRDLRPGMAAHYPDFQTRKALWYEIVDSNIIKHLRNERLDLALQQLVDVVGVEVASVLFSRPECSEVLSRQLCNRTLVVTA